MVQPELFSIGPFTIYSYGLMLGIAFITGSYLLSKEFERKKLPTNFATEITLLAIIFGIIGSKLFHLFENWDAFLRDPIQMSLSPGGLTFYGGLIVATFVIAIYLKIKKISFLYIADAAAPALMLGYGIGRTGCHFSGDGDYGIPTSLPWGVNYENGIVKPSEAFLNTEIALGFENGIVPDNTPLHPTPIYEFLFAAIAFYFLWKLRKKETPDGLLFMYYMIGTGVSRFLIEIIRINPRYVFGLSEAQIISVILILIGIVGIIYLRKNSNRPKYVPAPIIITTAKKKPK